MSKVWLQRGPTGRRFAATRQPLGILLRGLARLPALERQPQGRGSVRGVRHDLSALDASLQNRLGAAHPGCCADSSRAVGRDVREPARRRRVKMRLMLGLMR